MTKAGLYYSYLESQSRYMLAYKAEDKAYPYHFSERGPSDILKCVHGDTSAWMSAKGNIKYFLLPEGLIKW